MPAPLPLIGVSACVRETDGFPFFRAGVKYVTAVVEGAGGLPLIVPALGERLEPVGLLRRLDGLLLTGSPSNIEHHHYAGPLMRDDDLRDALRDATTLPLIRHAVHVGVPIFAICRGIQELNVALGGSLHPYVHEIEGRLDHRSDKSKPLEERYAPRHDVTLTKGGYLNLLFEGAETLCVNSLHGQAVDRVADGLVVEAVAEDGTVEALWAPDAPAFTLGVQWHPEYAPQDDPVSRRLFDAFGAACRRRAVARGDVELARPAAE